MFNWLSRWLRPDRSMVDQAQAHMTFGEASAGRTVARTRMFLRKQLWVWPIIAVLVLSVAGYAVSGAIDRTRQLPSR